MKNKQPKISHWTFKDLPNYEPKGNWIGFVYQITNKGNGKTYFGRKMLGAMKKRKFVPNDKWKTYTSSCKPLNESIKELGIENFEFKIIEFASNKRELGYKETKLLFARDVLNDPNCYNANILGKYFRSQRSQ